MKESMGPTMGDDWIPYSGLVASGTPIPDWTSFPNMDTSAFVFVGEDHAQREQKVPTSTFTHDIGMNGQHDAFSSYNAAPYNISMLGSSTMGDEQSPLTATYSVSSTPTLFSSTSPGPATCLKSETPGSRSPNPVLGSTASPTGSHRPYQRTPSAASIQSQYAHHSTVQSQAQHRRRRSKPQHTNITLPLPSTTLTTKSSSFSSGSSSNSARRPRLPHTEIERKYRQGLNSELDRLRKTIPALASRDMEEPRPSKATILASAIKYIQSIESEREELRREIGRLRAVVGAGRASGG